MSNILTATYTIPTINDSTIDPDAEIDLSDLINFKQSDTMPRENSGDGNPCEDRSFLGQYLYRCLGDFMKEAYVAKIENKRMHHDTKCRLFEEGFKCFQKKLVTDFDAECSPMDFYNTALWFKKEVHRDFGVDLRRCRYPERPLVTEAATTESTTIFTDIREASQTAMVAGIVMGVAVLFILCMIFFVIFKRRILGTACGSNSATRRQGNLPPSAATLQQQCRVNMTDTRSTLTGLSSDNSLQHTNNCYESTKRPDSQHIYTEIDTIAANSMIESQRVAPVGCSTFMTGYMPPDFSNAHSQGFQSTMPRDITVEYVQSGGYYNHVTTPVYQSTTVPLSKS